MCSGAFKTESKFKEAVEWANDSIRVDVDEAITLPLGGVLDWEGEAEVIFA